MREYKALAQQTYKNGEFAIVPIRHEDRFKIMKWRNEQIYHLRQKEPLNKKQQDNYFKEVISRLFNEDYPDQILFSFLKNGLSVGYGGLVHINWENRNAEISFIMDTKLQKTDFTIFWQEYLLLIEQVAFDELNLKKIYTFAYDFRKNLFSVLLSAKYMEDSRLKSHIKFEERYIDAVLHYKINDRISLREAGMNDARLTYDWFLDKKIREYSFSSSEVTFTEHCSWFKNKIESEDCIFLIAESAKLNIGSIRGDIENSCVVISFLLDSSHHGQGFGKTLLKEGVLVFKRNWPTLPLVGFVHKENIASQRIFESLGFHKELMLENIKYIK